MKKNAEMIKCCEDESEHEYRDSCWGCAPFWYHIPTCPKDKVKLLVSGYCQVCKKYYLIKKI